MLPSILVEILQGLLHLAAGQGKDVCVSVRYNRGLKIISASCLGDICCWCDPGRPWSFFHGQPVACTLS